MSSPRLVWLALVAMESALAMGTAARAQMHGSPALPPTAPTTAISPIAATPQQTPANGKPHRAEVTLNGEMLTVRANDSSLHQILRGISRQTGMKITGGVEDQRVFGSYGPAPASTILATLLDGMSVNVFIREGDTHLPLELTLTPRGGGSATPIAAQDDDANSEALDSPAPMPAAAAPVAVAPAVPVAATPVVTTPPSSPQPFNNVLGNPNNTTPTASQLPTVQSVPIDSIPAPTTTVQTQQGIVDSANPPTAGSTTPASTTPTTKTPDQIYQQLMDMKRARAAAASGTTQPANPPQ